MYREHAPKVRVHHMYDSATVVTRAGHRGAVNRVQERTFMSESDGLHPDSGAEIRSAVTSCPERKFPQAAVDAVDIPSS